MAGNLDRFLNDHIQDSGRLPDVVNRAKSRVQMAIDKNYTDDLKNSEIMKATQEIEDYISETVQREKQRVEKNLELAKNSYWQYENSPNRTNDLLKSQAYFSAMSTDEAQSAAVALMKGEEINLDPYEKDLLAKQISDNKKLHQQFRQHLQAENYREPWHKMLTPDDKKLLEITKKGQLPLKYKNGEIGGLDRNSILEMSDIKKLTYLEKNRIEEKFSV